MFRKTNVGKSACHSSNHCLMVQRSFKSNSFCFLLLTVKKKAQKTDHLTTLFLEKKADEDTTNTRREHERSSTGSLSRDRERNPLFLQNTQAAAHPSSRSSQYFHPSVPFLERGPALSEFLFLQTVHIWFEAQVTHNTPRLQNRRRWQTSPSLKKSRMCTWKSMQLAG